MIEFLFGVPGKLKTISDWLTTYWTAARAAKVDNLDAAISTRAAAVTALTNAMWTDARAGKLDLVTMGGIKSIQRGITTSSAAGVNVTISSVNLNKSFVISSCRSGQAYIGDLSGTHGISSSVTLTSATNLQISPPIAYGQVTNYPSISWEVIEFN